MKITKVYTKTGDAGKTSLVGGVRIDKSSARLEAYGTIDELTSHLGLLASMIRQQADQLQQEKSDELLAINKLVEQIQNNLFNVSSYLATDRTLLTDKPEWLDAYLVAQSRQVEALSSHTAILEHEVDLAMQVLPTLNSFVLPGGTLCASQCHVCRTVCRRAERRIVALMQESEVHANVTKYINRLSDYLFILARKLNFIAGENEKIWRKTCN